LHKATILKELQLKCFYCFVSIINKIIAGIFQSHSFMYARHVSLHLVVLFLISGKQSILREEQKRLYIYSLKKFSVTCFLCEKFPQLILYLIYYIQCRNSCRAWFKKMDSISYVYISWTIHGMWMIYITFERGGPKFSNTTARALA
jgi:hypothetical protein